MAILIIDDANKAPYFNQTLQTTVVQDDATARKKFPELNVEDRAGGFYEVQKKIYFSYMYFDCYICICKSHLYV